MLLIIGVQGHKLYHLGAKVFSRAALARCNEKQPHMLYKELFKRLLARWRKFKLNEKIYLLDASLVELSLSLFPWAKYQKNKGAC